LQDSFVLPLVAPQQREQQGRRAHDEQPSLGGLQLSDAFARQVHPLQNAIGEEDPANAEG
jgi:hypothetical protein